MKKGGKKSYFTRGIGLVEIVIGVAILSLSIFAISNFYQRALNVSNGTTKLTQASFLLEEGVEVVRFLRDESWQNISTLTAGVDYYITFGGGAWATTTTNTLIDGVFTRSFSVQNVNRDFSDDIVSSGGTLDPNTKQVTVTVSWTDGLGAQTRSISTYLTNFFSS